MQTLYIYRKNSKIKKYLEELQVLKKVIDLLSRLPHLEENLHRKSLLKSSLFSARIEGNKLKLEDVYYLNSEKKTKDIAKLEIFNLLSALRYIYSSKSPKKISESFLLKLHKMVLKNISVQSGYFRREPSAIFNQAGVAVYLPPPPTEIKSLVNKLITNVNSSKEPVPIVAAISHFTFEKIHPFLDGNGRTGRLLSTYILQKRGYGFRGLVSLEEYLENHRQIYYDLLGNTKKDITEFVEFFLEALVFQVQKAVKELGEQKQETREDLLLPRRREIFEIVKDHKMVSFDSLKRRFAKIPDSTLHYDLQQLIKSEFIRKLGTTRGVFYTKFSRGDTI